MKPDVISGQTFDLGYPQWRREWDPVHAEALAVFTDGVVLRLGTSSIETSPFLSPSPDHDGYLRLNAYGVAAYKEAKSQQQP